jgi:hypothetical protein
MKRFARNLLFTALLAIPLPNCHSAHAQGYGGPPMWDRGRNREYDRPDIPPPQSYGPRRGDCIDRGECGGLPPRDFMSPRYRLPPFPERRRDYY